MFKMTLFSQHRDFDIPENVQYILVTIYIRQKLYDSPGLFTVMFQQSNPTKFLPIH